MKTFVYSNDQDGVSSIVVPRVDAMAAGLIALDTDTNGHVTLIGDDVIKFMFFVYRTSKEAVQFLPFSTTIN